MSQEQQRLVRASREIAAPAATIFELIADPAQQPRWDGNDNLAEAAPDHRLARLARRQLVERAPDVVHGRAARGEPVRHS